MTDDRDQQPCARKTCSCTVPAGQTYCGPHCANASIETAVGSTQSGCACGHSSCGLAERSADAGMHHQGPRVTA